MSRPPRSSIEARDIAPPESQTMPFGVDVDPESLFVVTGESMEDDRMNAYASQVKNAKEENQRMLAFMEQVVEFTIAPTSDKNAPNPVECGVNGEHRRYKRGVRYKDKRKFVNALLKNTRDTTTREFTNGSGIYDTELNHTFVAAFPLTINYDPSGNDGHRWYEYTLRQER